MIKKLFFVSIIFFYSSLIAYNHTIKNKLYNAIIAHIGVVGGKDVWVAVGANKTKKVDTPGAYCSDNVEVYVLHSTEILELTKAAYDMKLERNKDGNIVFTKTGEANYVIPNYVNPAAPSGYISFTFYNDLSHNVIVNLENKFHRIKPGEKINLKKSLDSSSTLIAYIMSGDKNLGAKNYAKKEIPVLKRCSGNKYTISRNKNNNIEIEISD